MNETNPQELVIFPCAFVITGQGQASRPRILILGEPSVEGADAAKIVEAWLTKARATGVYPVINDLYANAGLELGHPANIAPTRPEIVASPRVNRELADQAIAARGAVPPEETGLPSEGIAVVHPPKP